MTENILLILHSAAVVILILILISFSRKNIILKQKDREKYWIKNEMILKNEMFEAFIQQTVDGVAVLGRDGRIIEWNNAQEKITGYNKEDVINQPIWEIQYKLIPSDIRNEEIKKQLEMVFKRSLEGDRNSLNYRIQEQNIEKKDGTRAVVNTVSFKMDLKDDFVIGNIMRDITRNKENEEKIKSSEKRYREIFDATGEAILILSNEDETIIDLNNKSLEMFEYRKEDMLGKELFDFSYHAKSEEKETFRKHIKLSRTSGYYNYECKLKNRRGEMIDAEISLSASKIGDTHRIVAVIRDISLKRQNQEIIIQNEKMLSVGGLAAGMAHEINNPLAGLMQTVNVIAQRLDPSANMKANIQAAEKAGITMDDLRKYIELRNIPDMIANVGESGKRIALIVENILSFSRKSIDERSTNNIVDIIEKSIELASTDYDLKKNYDFKKIAIKKEYEPDIPEIPCERTKIQQVLLNILKNGAQAMTEGEINNPEIKIKVHKDQERGIVIEIGNNGPEMDDEIKRRVFEPFYTTKPVGVGTGLGLSVSYFIIKENHGGDLFVESEPGQGVKFVIILPEKT